MTTDGGIGIFGGTFDPPHLGHIAAAERCRDALGLDRVLLVVANDPWQKSPGRPISPAATRVAMVAAAVEGRDRLELSTIEVERGGPSYSIETVEELGVPDPWLLVGSDLSRTLDSWERAEELRRRVRIAVLSRPGSRLELPAHWRGVALESDELDISSSGIRRRVREGRSLDDLVPAPVIRHIVAEGLYH